LPARRMSSVMLPTTRVRTSAPRRQCAITVADVRDLVNHLLREQRSARALVEIRRACASP
jgi:hypothetical protein